MSCYENRIFHIQSCVSLRTQAYFRLSLVPPKIKLFSAEPVRAGNMSAKSCVSCRTIILPSFNGFCCKLTKIYTLLVSRGAILNIKFMTSSAESNLLSWVDFFTLDPCLIARHQMSSCIKVQENRQSMTARG